MTNRRNFLKSALFGAGVMATLDPLRAATSLVTGRSGRPKPPTRFVFLHRGNGLWPKVMVPPSFDDALRQKEQRKEAIDVDLAWRVQPVG